MKNHKKQILFLAVPILLILVTVFCMKETVKSQRKEDRGVQNKYYAALEKEYVNALRNELYRQGYTNSGITVRWTAEEDDMRCYTVMIHHNRINDLDESGQAALLRTLSEIEFEDAFCRFCYEFITA